MYTLCIVLVLIASVLMVLAVLVQNPKSGMASNFGASNQVMGVRQTADFLEKATWSLAAFMVVISIVATYAIPQATVAEESLLQQNAVENSMVNPNTVPDFSEQAAPAEGEAAPAE